MLNPDDVEHLGDYTTPAANEADTQLLSQVFAAHLPRGAHVRALAEIAELIWVTPGDVTLKDGYELAPLSSQVLRNLAAEPQVNHTPLDMTLEAFETLVGEELDALDDEITGGLENLVFAVEDRPEDGSLDVLGVYGGTTSRGERITDTCSYLIGSCCSAIPC